MHAYRDPESELQSREVDLRGETLNPKPSILNPQPQTLNPQIKATPRKPTTTNTRTAWLQLPACLLDGGERHRHLLPNARDLPRIEKQQLFTLDDNVPVHASIALYLPPLAPGLAGWLYSPVTAVPQNCCRHPERTDDVRTTAHRTLDGCTLNPQQPELHAHGFEHNSPS